eukprot:scaffold36082_cov51-Phaeocystis_antarctica.AAC.3
MRTDLGVEPSTWKYQIRPSGDRTPRGRRSPPDTGPDHPLQPQMLKIRCCGVATDLSSISLALLPRADARARLKKTAAACTEHVPNASPDASSGSSTELTHSLGGGGSMLHGG